MSFSITLNTEEPASISEAELCIRWNKSTRTLLKYRKAGKTPTHFTKTDKYRAQVRYLLSDVEAFEKQNHISV